MNGIINVYKEAGYTSFDVVAKLRGILHMKHIGHTGTLDPDAIGVLPVCLGNATKVCDILTDSDKCYEATFVLGVNTTTLDMSGEVIRKREVNVTNEEVVLAIKSFVGSIKQIPPMYSALKVNGQKLCDLARKGVEVERKARDIKIYSIDILDISLPLVTIRVACQKGTYIRTLCEDIGEKLGTGGAVSKLKRIKAGAFEIENAYTLEQIKTSFEEGKIEELLTSVDSLFLEYDKANVKKEFEKLLANGNKLTKENLQNATNTDKIRVYFSDDTFAGLYEWKANEKIYKPLKMFLG